MQELKVTFVMLSAVILLNPGSALAGTANRDYGVIENQNSPYAKLKSVDLKDVRWTEGFWAMRFTQTR
ncbi:MAG TPA: hypothetical protein VMW24_03700, partial [Sedimentisphaerales bacterium]|nr:hypothetical protein [Sedimentisphaerales bacterium]